MATEREHLILDALGTPGDDHGPEDVERLIAELPKPAFTAWAARTVAVMAISEPRAVAR